MEAIQSPIQYVGEHLLLAKTGQFSIFLALSAALLAGLTFWRLGATKSNNDPLTLSLAKGAIIGHVIGVWSTIALLFYAMISHFYEFHYVWQHVSDDLPLKYIFSAFWEGQEGSFLLWLFWHTILILFLFNSTNPWKYTAIGVLSFIQIAILSMILGVHVPIIDFTLGSNPFIFIRDKLEIPLFQNANYITLIKGNGLNPLLQNYWMTIHPPTLFLGFASVSVPYALAISALRSGDHKSWLVPAKPWVLFSATILGLGILMGGAWAYEALSFGGYWAWDPVENMSLVPWLILLAGLHCHLIAQSTGHSIRAVYIFYLLSFIMIVYSTFLTRSGILGDSSVHSFTEMGLEWQLIIFLAVFTVLGAFFYFKKQKSISSPLEEESIFSREFWMFIGSLVLVFSCILISTTTSIPVFNKIMDGLGWLIGAETKEWHRSAPVDTVGHHNKFQLWVGILMALLSTFAMALRYRSISKPWETKTWIKRFLLAFGIAISLHLLVLCWLTVSAWQYHLFLFAGLLTFSYHLVVLINAPLSSWKYFGSSVSHLGFGVLIVGIIASGLNKKFISSNPFIQRGLIKGESEEDLAKNIRLDKNLPMFMSGYLVEYQKDSFNGVTRTFDLKYKKLDEKGEKITEEFELHPNILYSKDFSKIAASNPDTKHYLHKDIFTHIASLPTDQVSLEEAQKKAAELKYEPMVIKKNEWTLINDSISIRYDSFYFNPSHHELNRNNGDWGIGSDISVKDGDSIYHQKMVTLIKDGSILNLSDHNNKIGMNFRMGNDVVSQIISPDFNGTKGHEMILKARGSSNFHHLKLEFLGFEKNPFSAHFKPENTDIVVGAKVLVHGNKVDTLTPLYIIRGNQPFGIASQSFENGISIKMKGIDIQNEAAILEIFDIQTPSPSMTIETAKADPKFEFVVLQAIEFPGINLVWIGSLLMLLGLFIGLFVRRKANK